MHAITQVQTVFRPARAALIVLVALSLLVAAPRVTHPGFPPKAPQAQAAPPQPDGLRALLASMADLRDEGPVRPDRHAVRRAVTGYAVRLTVDPTATHPQDGRLAVRQAHLGTPGKRLRHISLASADPPEPVRKATVPVRPAPAAQAAPQPLPVKIPSPPLAAPASVLTAGRSVLVAGD